MSQQALPEKSRTGCAECDGERERAGQQNEDPDATARPGDGHKPEHAEEVAKKTDPKDAEPASHKTEDPARRDFDVWLASLPAQVRKTYEGKDWDAIPPKYRELIRLWSRRMAERDLERDR